MLWDDDGRERVLGTRPAGLWGELDRPQARVLGSGDAPVARVVDTRREPTVRLRVLAVNPSVRPISVAVIGGRARRPGELGWARLQRQPQVVMARPPLPHWRRLAEGWAVTVLLLCAAIAVVAVLTTGVVLGFVTLLGLLWGALRGLLAVVGLASVLVGAGGHGAMAMRWPATDMRPAVVLVADICLACDSGPVRPGDLVWDGAHPHGSQWN